MSNFVSQARVQSSPLAEVFSGVRAVTVRCRPWPSPPGSDRRGLPAAFKRNSGAVAPESVQQDVGGRGGSWPSYSTMVPLASVADVAGGSSQAMALNSMSSLARSPRNCSYWQCTKCIVSLEKVSSASVGPMLRLASSSAMRMVR